jgi:hypothetical protein
LGSSSTTFSSAVELFGQLSVALYHRNFNSD